MEPAVSIIIPVFNQWDFTRQCIESIQAHDQGVSYEIVLADDCSTDETTEAARYFPGVRVVRGGLNAGFIGNCNRAAKEALGRYLFFLNNDTVVQPGCLKSLTDTIEADPTIGIVGPKLLYPDGSLQEAGGIIWKDTTGWNYGQGQDKTKPEFNYRREVDYISGAALMIRRDLWEGISGFDERYAPAYFEDADMAFSVRARGYRVVFQPRAEIIHFEGKSHGTDINAGVKANQIRNMPRFREKWAHALESDHFRNAEHVFWARDRSRKRLSILVIDHYIPHWDRDAGSRTMFDYLKLCVRMGFNVKFIGANYFPHEPYLTTLQQMGIEVLYGPWYANNWREWMHENGKYFDAVWLNRPHISVEYIDQVRASCRGAAIVYYVHDVHHLRLEAQYVATGSQAAREAAKTWKGQEDELFGKMDAIMTPSVKEAEYLSVAYPGLKIQVIPCFIRDDIQRDRRSFADRHGLLFVGGFGHPPNLDGVRWFMAAVWPHVVAALPNVKLRIVGSYAPPEIEALERESIEIRSNISDEELLALYKASRMAIMPLRYGGGVKGKTVDALCHGLPMVSTEYGIEGLPCLDEIVRPKDGPREFAEEIIRLYPDFERLGVLAACYQGYARDWFSSERADAAVRAALGI